MTDFFDDLKRDLEAATPGPWVVFSPKVYDILPGLVVETRSGEAVVWYTTEPGEGIHRDEDAALIARAPQLAKLALLLPELRSALVYALDDARGWIDCEGMLKEHGFDASGAMLVCEVVSSALAKLDAAIEEIGQ